MSKERVSVEIRVGNTTWSLITSQDQADRFVEEWKSSVGDSIINIFGVLIHQDANNIEYHLKKEEITGVMIQEIKL